MRFPTLALTRSGSGSVAVTATLSAWLPKLPERGIRAARYVSASVCRFPQAVKRRGDVPVSPPQRSCIAMIPGLSAIALPG